MRREGIRYPLLQPTMRDKWSFQDPLNEEPDGTYITTGQMQFFLNRKDGREKFKTGHKDFLEYYNICRIYNKVSDIMDDEPESAIMYWDDKKGVVSMGFPTDGTVSKALSGISPHSVYFEEDEDEDEFGFFK